MGERNVCRGQITQVLYLGENKKDTILDKMPSDQFDITPYKDLYRQQMLALWEQSVLATHDFLLPADFEEIKRSVASIPFHELHVFCLTNIDTVIGFIGVANKKIEILFLAPDFFGRGLGQKLLHFAVEKLDADQLDVNEQNWKAVRFYQKFGFETYERTNEDDQGRNYPLLRMKWHTVRSIQPVKES